MIKKIQTAKELLKAAKIAPSKDQLAEHIDAILMLRDKRYSWRDIASFLNEHGVETDHSKIFRFINKQRRNKMDPYEKYFIPTYDQYLAVLKDMEKNITEKQKDMLGFHYKAHNRTVTFGELADIVDYPDYKTANLQYGKLGSVLGEKLGMIFAPLSRDDNTPFKSSSIGMGNIYKKEDSDFQIVMHHELSKALRELGWFEE
ncbi:MAG: hypothetical protein HN441_06995 [Candidatus Thioglobus sp.]|jgi:hypothetical protein|nr:hypothetical protein [Candidatus Thioglobus sp.]